MAEKHSELRVPHSKILAANRGEIACRIIRGAESLGLPSVAVYSEADRAALHVRQADESVLLGPAPAKDSYLRSDRILATARDLGVAAIHPGYGFLSENAEFAEACEGGGIAFVGPSPEQLRQFGLKHTARALAEAAGVPLLPGTELLESAEAAGEAANAIGYPVMLKSTAGGGGIGMQVCANADELASAFATVQRLGESNFSNAGVFLEKFVGRARHVEVQIFGDGNGDVIALGERDCSAQRRNQKVLEETPAPKLPDATRTALLEAAVALGKSVNYRSAGTVEFLYDADGDAFYFLEVNTRLQVEHGVTEEVTGHDLVAMMLQLALGTLPPLSSIEIAPAGHSIEARLYAEDPNKNFQPCAGLLTAVHFPEGVRIDTWVDAGTEVPGYYDPLLAKVIATAPTRDAAIAKLEDALRATRLAGIETNRLFVLDLLADERFRSGEVSTKFADSVVHVPATVDVVDGGVMTTVQDYPGRTGHWDVGVPPSGPMDDYAFRLANEILGNSPDAAALEITVSGPTLRFHRAATVCLTGAKVDASIPMWETVAVAAGDTVRIGATEGAGQRAYLAVAGGLDVPLYLGSRSTFTLGRFGGHAGRALLPGDVLHLDPDAPAPEPFSLAEEQRPDIGSHWEIGVLYGPHGAPDFFTDGDIGTFFATDWEVHYNSARTGVRLIGPKPEWARTDGGEAGLHPSNIHDNAYAVGAIDFTGDMPVILGPDGPSLGGFVCPATLAKAELWKLGQLKPGDTIRFVPVALSTAYQLEDQRDQMIRALRERTLPAPAPIASLRAPLGSPVLEVSGDVVYRLSGDDNILVEFGPAELDLNLRFRAHAVMLALAEKNLDGILDLTPGIRSLQVHFDRRVLPIKSLIAHLEAASTANHRVPSRIVHLPLAWNDEQTQLAIQKYAQSVRADAPWCPSNLEFIRRINGLDSIEAVKKTVFDASYLVMGLGDVYLGAPVATPLDPRHRLVTTKYNPARTWTPENAVGIGGAYLCVYGMEGPGGYQFVGRTCQVWNRFRQTAEFAKDTPWLLRFFDQIRFYEVSEAELLEFREDFPAGKVGLKIEETTFDLDEYNAFLDESAGSIADFRSSQRQAFADERARWKAAGQDVVSIEEPPPPVVEDVELPDGCRFISNHVAGNLWKIAAEVGQRVEAGDPVVIVESMKMEIAIPAPESGTVVEVLCQESTPVTPGQKLAIIRPDA